MLIRPHFFIVMTDMQPLFSKHTKAYLFMLMLSVSGLTASNISAAKVVHIGVNFPFSNLIFSIFTFPVVDSICEVWGRRAAFQAVVFGLMSQVLFMLLIQVSILAPAASFWHLQDEYINVLSVTGKVVLASGIAFSISQVMDVMIYQRIKDWSQGRWMWLRGNVSTVIGQAIDSAIFIAIIFSTSAHKMDIFMGSMTVKITIAVLMTPFMYALVYGVRWYLTSGEEVSEQLLSRA